MRKFDLNTKPKAGGLPSMLKDYCESIIAHKTLQDWLKDFEFTSREEIERVIKDLYYGIKLDPFLHDKDVRKGNEALAIMWDQASRLVSNEGKLDRLAQSVAQDLWHKYYLPLKREKDFAAMFSGKRDAARYEAAYIDIQNTYSLTDADMDKIAFFVLQVRERDKFPPSLRRMLYLWGSRKKTGKTTCAKMIVSILNGSDDYEHADPNYATSLANEMQVGSFKVPKIASCNVAMMDECFFRNMGNVYNDFKRFMTCSGGTARLPYGQEFQWSGSPNYVATSNEPLKTFIQDWNDRRYLSVEFKGEPKKMSMDKVFGMWKDFICNIEMPDVSWSEWSNEMSDYADEIGEKQEMSNEYIIELQKPYVINTILDLPDGKSATSADNKLTTKFFIGIFQEREGYEAAKHRKEIEAAVLEVYGERWNGYGFWRIDIVKDKARKLLDEIRNQSLTF